MHLYELAIRSAHANGFIHNEAIAYEIAARFYAARGFDKIADTYFLEARYGYLRWGAEGKVRQLDQQYPQLRQEKPVASSTSMIAAPVKHLELATVIKVSQAVSSEIVLDKLIDTLMKIALEHAGAERGLLILRRGDDLRIEAEAMTGHDSISVRLLRKPPTPSELATSVLAYVLRTKESVILDDASATNQFSADAYIGEAPAVTPLFAVENRGILAGVLYLENNVASTSSTPSRIDVFKLLLVSQAAISLENAWLYDDQQKENRERQRAEKELQQLVDSVSQMIVVLDAHGNWIHANRVAREYAGLTLDEYRSVDVIGRVVHPDDAEEMRGVRERGFLGNKPFELEARLLGKDGVYRWFLFRYNPLVEEGQVRRWYATATEIESRKQEEERVRKENVRLEERTRIAQELHDTLLQTFLSASMQLSVALDGVAPDSLVKPCLDRILQLMNQGIAEGRNTIQGLRSRLSEDWIWFGLSRVQQELEVQPDVDFASLSSAGSGHFGHPLRRIYRIGREALVSAFCHSGPSASGFRTQ